MRKEFFDVRTRRQAVKAAPWACDIIRVDGGYVAFESAADADVFRGQR